MILLHPGNPPSATDKTLSPRRFTSLDGMRLGLLGNSKLNADNVLEAVADLLKQRYDIKTVLHRTKPSFSHPAPDALFDEMIENCDVVIAGVGD
ncbi:MAG TPA: hypothetical protein VFY10_16430 [Dehalococcoidia bacterium]|nr:hypothetical protein [Dehalococcoidia bacterium]